MKSLRVISFSIGNPIADRLMKFCSTALMALTPATVTATLPLITDDTDTLLLNKTTYQLELSIDRLRNHVDGVVEKASTPAVTFTFGLTDPLDIYIETSYTRVTKRAPDIHSERISGLGDTSLGMKWRFYDKDNLSLAIKPHVTFATGDENKGLGTGRTSGSFTALTAYEAAPFTWLANVAYQRSNYKLPADRAALRSDLVRVSAAALVKVHEKTRLFGDVGSTTNVKRASNRRSAYVLLGLIYSPSKNVDLDAGLRFGFNDTEVDRVWSVGTTFRF